MGNRSANRPRANVRVFTTTLAATAAVLVGLTGCVVLEGPTPVTPTRTPVPVPEAPAALNPEGTAAENEPFFTTVLQEFVASEAPVQGVPIVNALADAGFDKATMQVTADLSKTNLVADSLFVSSRFGDGCLLGQITSDTRELAISVAPAVGPDSNVCLIGATRPIDW